jgi:hypothetical protein
MKAEPASLKDRLREAAAEIALLERLRAVLFAKVADLAIENSILRDQVDRMKTKPMKGTAMKKSTPAPAPQDRPATVTAPLPTSLEQIRERSLRVRSDANRTIAELEAWRDEIESTIAFLKAQGGRR